MGVTREPSPAACPGPAPIFRLSWWTAGIGSGWFLHRSAEGQRGTVGNRCCGGGRGGRGGGGALAMIAAVDVTVVIEQSSDAPGLRGLACR